MTVSRTACVYRAVHMHLVGRQHAHTAGLDRRHCGKALLPLLILQQLMLWPSLMWTDSLGHSLATLRSRLHDTNV